MTRRSGVVLTAALALGYGIAFAALTYPRIRQFSSYFWADLGDGLENVWNLWWVRKALVDLHQSPWHTTYLQYPFGISLHAHAFSPFNGFLALPLASVLSPPATHNAVVLFAFVSAGVTAFWLAFTVTASVAASALAGYVFTFSAYHFAHTGAHLNLIAIQWLPLFLLCWLRLLERPGTGAAVASALALFGVYLCDYYYFAYCVLAAALLAAGEAVRRGDWLFLLRRLHRRALAVFLVAFALTTGILLVAFLRAYLDSPFVGGHDPRLVSLDLLAPFVPGGHSRFAGYTAWYWRTAGGNVNENSVYLGVTVLVLVGCALIPRRRWYRLTGVDRAAADDGGSGRLGRWYGLLAIFAVLALGPHLQVAGYQVPGLLLPYGWLESLLPMMRLGGVPIRAFVMVTLAAAVLCAAGMQRLLASGGRARALAVALVVLLVIETLPGPIPASAPPPRSFAAYLAAQPGTEAYIEIADPPLPAGVALYYQTVHEKPMAFGHTSRGTVAARAGERRLREAIAGDYRALRCRYGFRWLLADDGIDLDAPAATVELWEEGRSGKIYDLERRFGACPQGPGSPPHYSGAH